LILLTAVFPGLFLSILVIKQMTGSDNISMLQGPAGFDRRPMEMAALEYRTIKNISAKIKQYSQDSIVIHCNQPG
jgi:hypothetical protein